MEGNSGGRVVLLVKMLIFSLMLSHIAARFCRDKDCQDPISEGRVVKSFDSEDENFLPVQRGDVVFIISKSENKMLFEVEVGGSRGLVPAKYVKETRPFVQEENLLHIVHDEAEDGDRDDAGSTSHEDKGDADEKISNNADSKQTQRSKLLQFVQDIEGGMQLSGKTENKEGDEEMKSTAYEPLRKNDIEGSVSLVKEEGSAGAVDRGSNNNNEDDLQDEDVGFKGAVTAPHTNEQDRSDIEGKINHRETLSAEEWVKNPQFLELRERQLEDYMKDHFSGQETTDEIRRLALDLITNDLLTQVNNRENGLYEMLRRGSLQEDTTGGSRKGQSEVADMKDKEPRLAENSQSLRVDDPLNKDGLKSKGDMGKPSETTEIPIASPGIGEGAVAGIGEGAVSGSSQTLPRESSDKLSASVQEMSVEKVSSMSEKREKSEFSAGDQVKATPSASSASLSSEKNDDDRVSTTEAGSGELAVTGTSVNQAENGIEVRPTPSQGNEGQEHNFFSLQYNLPTMTPSTAKDAVSTDSKEPLVQEQDDANEKVNLVKKEGTSHEPTNWRLEPVVTEEKKESGKEEERKEEKKDAAEDPKSSKDFALGGERSQPPTGTTSHEPARQTSEKQNVVDATLTTEGTIQDNGSGPIKPIAAANLPNLQPTNYEDRNASKITSAPTVGLEETTYVSVSDHQPTHHATTEIENKGKEEKKEKSSETDEKKGAEEKKRAEEEKGTEEEDPSDSSNEQLLALCHVHPTLEACARLRGAKISRGSKDMDLRQTESPPPQTLLYKLRRISYWILKTLTKRFIQILKISLSIIRAPFGLVGISEPFDLVIDGLDQVYSFTLGTITVMILAYPVFISPTVRFIVYMKNRNKAVKMRSDCERSFIERAKIADENCAKYREEMKVAKDNLRTERQERELVEHEMTELKDTIEKLKEVITKEKSLAETNLRDLQAALKEQDALRTMIEQKEQEITQADLMVSKHQKEIENQRETTNSLTTRLEEFQVELMLKDNEIENLQSLVGVSEKEKVLADQLRNELTEDIKNMETRLNEIKQSVAEKEQERELLEDQIETKDTELEVLRGILMSINSEKNLDGETKDSYEAPDDDPDIQDQLKKERLTKLMDTTAALTQVKSLEEENKVLTEALGDEIEARKALEVDLEKTKRELLEASNNYKEFKAKADAGEIKLSTLREYFHAQEAELHRKLTAQETARIVSERRLDDSLADSTSSVKEASMLRKQLEDLKQEIKAVERSKQDSENKKDMDYHDLYVKTRQCQRDLEEMTRERDYYRKRLLDKEQIKRSSPPQTRKADSEGRASPRDSVDGGRAVSPQSQHSGKFSGIGPGGIGTMGAQFRPIPAQGMFGAMVPPVPPMPPMPGAFHPGMMPPGMVPPAMMPRMPVAMPGGNTPPQAGQVGSPFTAGGPGAMRPPFRQKLSDISSASVPPSSMTQPNVTLQATNTVSPFTMQTPPTVQQPSQVVRPVPRTSTPGMAFSGSAQISNNAAFQVPGHPGMPPQTTEFRGPRNQFYSPQGGFSPVPNQTHPGLNNTYPGQASASGDQGKGHNTLV